MLRFICTVLITLALCTAFSSCASLNQQKPTPASEYAGLRKATFNDGTILSYASDAGDLQARKGNLSDSYYNGKQMILGVLDPVFFSFDSMAIDPSQRPTLSKAAQYLSDNPQYDLLIKGRCDWYGTEEYNLALGDLRANSAALYLEDLGIDKARVNTVSLGSLEATIGLSKSAAKKDRKAELILLK